MEQKTPLYEAHVRCGGKIVPFAGWLLPVQYGTGVIAEHMAVRTKCGLFDVSHMGEITCKGADALKNINLLLTNDYTDMESGTCRYSPMCNEHGGCVDDLIVYKCAENDYLLVVNAANTDKDFAWMCAHKTGDVVLENISANVAQLALQGPLAENILQKIADAKDIPQGYYTFTPHCRVQGMECLISRTGYTGEDGFEIYLAPENAEKMWNALLAAGGDDILPCGLGARDTLRLEAAMPLYGHEMDDEVSPREAGLGIFVKMDKEDFIGKAALEKMGKPAPRKRVGLVVIGRGIIREHEDVFVGDTKIGVTTSGTMGPFVGKAVAMARVEKDSVAVGDTVEVDVRGRRIPAEVVKLPFYKREK